MSSSTLISAAAHCALGGAPTRALPHDVGQQDGRVSHPTSGLSGLLDEPHWPFEAAQDYAASRALVKLSPTGRDSMRLDFSEIENQDLQDLLLSEASDGSDPPAGPVHQVVGEIRRQGESIVLVIRFEHAGTAPDRDGKPHAKAGLPPWRLKRAVAFIDAHLEENISLKELAGIVGLSPTYFSSQFKETTGYRPRDYILQRKILSAKEQLLDLRLQIIEIAISVGFQSHAHFSTAFRRIVGMTPTRWRRENYDGTQVRA
jgi:AraC-like DNA-binding protein